MEIAGVVRIVHEITKNKQRRLRAGNKRIITDYKKWDSQKENQERAAKN